MASYNELKVELEKIADLIGKFPEVIKPMVYDLLLSKFLGEAFSYATPLPNEETEAGAFAPPKKTKANPKKTTNTKPEKTSTRKPSKESYQIDRNLNLSGDKSIPSFKVFYAEKKPNSAGEVNVVGVYYLQKLLGLTNINLNQLFTCYKEVSHRPPEAFKQSYSDTKHKKGWVEFDESGNLQVPHRGVIYVEHDLPKTTKPKKT